MFRRCALLLTVLAVGLSAAPASATGEYRPDEVIRSASALTFRGDGIYNEDGSRQTSTVRIGARAVSYFYVGLQNDGRMEDRFRVRGSMHTTRFSVRYFLGDREVSTAVKAGTLMVGPLASGQRASLRVRIATRNTVPRGTTFGVRVVARSLAADRIDVTRATVDRPLYSAEQETVQDQINASRSSRGLGRLSMNRMLADKAQAWADHLASIGDLDHSNLASGVPSNWRALAENVGYYSSLGGVHHLFMESPDHRANILGPYNYVGTGVGHRGSLVYVVHVFMRA